MGGTGNQYIITRGNGNVFSILLWLCEWKEMGLKKSFPHIFNACAWFFIMIIVKDIIMSRFSRTSVLYKTESCLPNLGHLVVTSDTSGLPDN